MTSKISFCIKLIRSDIRHRGWLAALSGTLFFLMMPVYTMLYLSTYTNPASDLIFYFPGLINGLTLRYLAAAIAVLAILSALTGFSWIHSRERLDFFHSLPVKRTTWFTATYLSGLIIVLVPYIVCCVLTIAAGAADTGMTAELAGRSAEAALGGVLAFFIIYNACVFALMLTGRTVTGLLASLAVIVYPFIVFVLISSLETAFFRSFYSDSLTLPQKLAKYLSPFGLFSAVIEQSAAGALGISVTAAVCLMSALFIAAAVLLYRIYPSETAGNAVAFPSISPALKVLICIPTALFISLMIKNLMMLEGNILLFPLGLLAAVLLCAVIEFIYTMDLKLLLKGWKSSLISIAGVMAVLCFFHLDLPGYDTYIPDKEKIESISFCPDSFSSYFSYPETGNLQETPTGYFAPEEMNDTLYALAQSGIDNLKNGIDSQNVYDGNTDDGNYLSAVFRYRLSGGRTITRQYAVAYKDAAGALEELLGSTEYRKQIFPFFYIDRSSVTSISLSDIYGTFENMSLDKDQREALLKAYETDVLKVSADTFINTEPIGELYVEYPNTALKENSGSDTVSPHYSSSGSDPYATVPMLYLYPEYTNTLALLDEYGYSLRTKIDPDDISSITLYLTDSAAQSKSKEGIDLLRKLSNTAETTVYSDSSADISVTSQEDIALLLNYTGAYANGILGDGNKYFGSVDIYYKTGDFHNYPLKL